MKEMGVAERLRNFAPLFHHFFIDEKIMSVEREMKEKTFREKTKMFKEIKWEKGKGLQTNEREYKNKLNIFFGIQTNLIFTKVCIWIGVGENFNLSALKLSWQQGPTKNAFMDTCSMGILKMCVNNSGL